MMEVAEGVQRLGLEAQLAQLRTDIHAGLEVAGGAASVTAPQVALTQVEEDAGLAAAVNHSPHDLEAAVQEVDGLRRLTVSVTSHRQLVQGLRLAPRLAEPPVQRRCLVEGSFRLGYATQSQAALAEDEERVSKATDGAGLPRESNGALSARHRPLVVTGQVERRGDLVERPRLGTGIVQLAEYPHRALELGLPEMG